MDNKKEKEIKKICDNFIALCINSIIQLKCPEIDNYFPDYPKDFPQKWLFQPPKRLEKISSSKARMSCKKGKELAPKEDRMDDDELNNSVPKIKSKRKCHFSGTYNIEKNLEKLFEEKSEPKGTDSTDLKHPVNCIKSSPSEDLGVQKISPELAEDEFVKIERNLQSFKTFIIKKRKKKISRIRSLSETSSDEEEEVQEKLDLSNNFNIIIKRCDSQVNLTQNSFTSPKKSQTSDNIATKTCNQLPKLVMPKSQKVQDCKALKSIFQESTSFDEAMKKYAEKKNELQKIAPVKVIPAPEQDPAIKKVVKKKPIKAKETITDETNSNKNLGGIFTINNGWDKQESKEIEMKNQNKGSTNKLERKVTPPNIVIDTNMEDVMDAHDEYMHNEDLMNNLVLSQDSKTSFSPASSHSLQIAMSSDKLNDTDSSNEHKFNSSLNSSEEDSENEQIFKAPPKKIQKLLFSDDEDDNEVELALKEREYHNKNDNDVVSLFAEAGEFDDLEEEQFYAEVDADDLKLKVQCVKRKIEPLDYQTEFDLNTKEILKHTVDPKIDKILKTYFSNVCPAFLENSCSMPDCRRSHSVPEESSVYPLLINANFDVLRNVFQVILKYHRLFKALISLLVQICVKNNDETGLKELVKSCDRTPQLISCYKDIVRKLVELDYMKEHKAISFIIAHHTDSEIARDTILSLILDSGPCITLFVDYIEKAHIKQPIRSDMFSRILHTCVAYQNPKLPNFCLNYLQGLNAHQMKNLNSEHLKAFLQMNKCISELNENREAKALKITQKLLSSMDW